jgi:DNA-binding protein YbaB
VDADDVETLQDLIVGALADLNTKRDALTQQKMGPLAGGLGGGFPGLGG